MKVRVKLKATTSENTAVQVKSINPSNDASIHQYGDTSFYCLQYIQYIQLKSSYSLSSSSLPMHRKNTYNRMHFDLAVASCNYRYDYS